MCLNVPIRDGTFTTPRSEPLVEAFASKTDSFIDKQYFHARWGASALFNYGALTPHLAFPKRKRH